MTSSTPSVQKAALSYAAFRLGIFFLVLVPLVVVIVVLGGPPFVYVAAVALASVASAAGALVKGRERREQLEFALQASRSKRVAAQADYRARVSRGPVDPGEDG